MMSGVLKSEVILSPGMGTTPINALSANSMENHDVFTMQDDSGQGTPKTCRWF